VLIVNKAFLDRYKKKLFGFPYYIVFFKKKSGIINQKTHFVRELKPAETTYKLVIKQKEIILTYLPNIDTRKVLC